MILHKLTALKRAAELSQREDKLFLQTSPLERATSKVKHLIDKAMVSAP